MTVWKRHLNSRVRLHLTDGTTIEGRLRAVTRSEMVLLDAAVFPAPDARVPLDGTTVVARARVVVGQVVSVPGE